MSDPLAPYLDLIAELADVGAAAVDRGLVIGSGGNLSARLPGDDQCVVTGAETRLDALTPASFTLVRIADGTVLGGHPRPSSELALHLENYKARPDIRAVVHAHPQMSVLLSALGRPVRLITTDHVNYVRAVRVAPYHHPGTPDVARSAADLIADGQCNCVILAHHGCSVVADTVDLAGKRLHNLEEAARATYHALLLGDEHTDCPPQYAERLTRLAPDRH